MQNDKNISVKVRGIVVSEGKLLVVRHDKDADFSAIPGGKLEYGEDIKECLIRELVEELGVKAEIGRLMYVNNYTSTSGTQDLEFFFEVLNGEDFAKAEKLTGTHASEIVEISWVSRESDTKIMPESVGRDFKNGDFDFEEVRFVG